MKWVPVVVVAAGLAAIWFWHGTLQKAPTEVPVQRLAPIGRPDLLAARRELLQSLGHGRAARISLGQSSDLPPLAAPILAIEPGGHLRLLRAPPVPKSPTGRIWELAAIALPHGLSELAAVERAALLDSLTALCSPQTCDQDVMLVGPAAGEAAEALLQLLRWQR